MDKYSRIDILKKEIQKFKDWASQYPKGQRYGEWECDYDFWAYLYDTFIGFIENSDYKEWSVKDKNDLLYVIARDNEAQYLSSEISKIPHRLLLLAKAALNSNEVDAKWQLAEELGEVQELHKEAEECLLSFVKDSEEYVSRIALMALANLSSLHTEELCVKAWETGHEYQRIAVLESLKRVSSNKLSEYLVLAIEDGRKYLVNYASKIISTVEG
jgi:hypothetical protein